MRQMLGNFLLCPYIQGILIYPVSVPRKKILPFMYTVSSTQQVLKILLLLIILKCVSFFLRFVVFLIVKLLKLTNKLFVHVCYFFYPTGTKRPKVSLKTFLKNRLFLSSLLIVELFLKIMHKFNSFNIVIYK